MLPVLTMATSLIGIMKGPVSNIIDHYVSDAELRQKLKAEIESSFLESMSKISNDQANVITAEVNSEHWLTSNWRPLVMMILMGFLVWVGLILPLADIITGTHIAYEPRWQQLPSGFWDFLSIGVGGYIGGRSLEKITEQVFSIRKNR